MADLLYSIFAAHVEWKGRRSTLTGMEHKFFHRWVARVYPRLITTFGDNALFRQQCREIQRGNQASPRQATGLGKHILEKYAPQLVQSYLLTPAEKRPSFGDFLNQILSQCQTENALRRLLGIEAS